MHNISKLIQGTLLFLLGQVLVWYQINGQFISDWIKERPLVMSLMGVPISFVYIYPQNRKQSLVFNQLANERQQAGTKFDEDTKSGPCWAEAGVQQVFAACGNG